MKNIYLFLLVLLAVSFGQSVRGQSTLGTDFWLGYMENLTLQFNNAPEFTIVISATQPTTGEITIPFTGFNLPFSVGAGVTEVDLPPSVYYTTGSEIIENKGLRITTDQPVSVSAFHYRIFFSESTQLLTAGSLGTDYLITTPVDDEPSNHPASFVVVATQNNTVVEITPAAVTLGLRPPGIPFTVTLQAGQNYQVQALGDLSASRVRTISGGPMAVFQGVMQANIGDCPGFADSHVWDQALPSTMADDLYHFVPFENQGGDVIKILAMEANTDVFFDCELVASLGAGETFTTFRSVATVISSTGPIQLSQYNTENDCEPSGVGDPNGLTYLPAGYRGNSFSWLASNREVVFLSSAPYFTVHNVSIVAPANAINGVTLDGQSVSGFQPFSGDPTMFWTSFSVTAGAHEISSSQPIQAYAYGMAEYDAYTQNLGFQSISFPPFACFADPCEDLNIPVTFNNDLSCAGEESSLTYFANVGQVSRTWRIDGVIVGSNTVLDYIFPTPGDYEVSIEFTTTDGCVVEESITVSIEVCADPCEDQQPNLTIFPDLDCAGELSSFIYASEIEAISESWSINGMAEGFETDFDFVFPTPGTYKILLQILTADGCVFSTFIFIDIESCPDPCEDLQANLMIFPELSCAGEPSAFGYSADVAASSIEWRIDGVLEGNQETLNFTFATPGIYEVSLQIETAAGCIFSIATSVVIESCPDPCEDLQANLMIFPELSCAGEPSAFGYSADVVASSIEWRIDGVLEGNQGTLDFTFATPGIYEVSLQIETAAGCIFSIATSVVIESCPDPCEDLNIPITFIFDLSCAGQSSSLAYNAPVSQVGRTWRINGVVVSFAFSLQYIFPTAGNYEVSIEFTTADGCILSESEVVNIQECIDPCEDVDPLLVIGSQVECVDEISQFTFASQETVVAQNWWIDGELVGTDPTLDYIFTTIGIYFVEIEIENEDGCLFSTEIAVNVEACTAVCDTLDINLQQIAQLGCVDALSIFDYSATELVVDQYWTINGEEVSQETTLAYSFPAPGEYAVGIFVITAEGCQRSLKIFYTIEACPDPCEDVQANLMIFPELSCAGEASAFGYSADVAASSIEWRIDGVLEGNQGILDFTFATPGTYEVSVQLETAAGCVFITATSVVIEACPDPCLNTNPNINTIIDVGCPEDSTLLNLITDANVDSIVWVVTGDTLAQDSSTAIYIFDSIGLYSYQVTIFTEEGCSFSFMDSLLIKDCTDPCSLDSVVFSFTTDLGCAGEESFLDATTATQLAAQNWVVEGDTLLGDSSSLNYTFDTAGLIAVSVEVLTITRCTYRLDTFVTIEDCPVDCSSTLLSLRPFAAGSRCLGGRNRLYVHPEPLQVDIDSIVWQLEDGSSFYGPVVGGFNPDSAGTYTFQITIYQGDGCAYNYPFSVAILDCATTPGRSPYVPGIYRLGSGVLQPTWPVDGDVIVPDYTFTVYDLAGRLIHQSDNQKAGWRSNSVATKTGIYVYRLSYFDEASGNWQQRVGRIVVVE